MHFHCVCVPFVCADSCDLSHGPMVVYGLLPHEHKVQVYCKYHVTGTLCFTDDHVTIIWLVNWGLLMIMWLSCDCFSTDVSGTLCHQEEPALHTSNKVQGMHDSTMCQQLYGRRHNRRDWCSIVEYGGLLPAPYFHSTHLATNTRSVSVWMCGQSQLEFVHFMSVLFSNEFVHIWICLCSICTHLDMSVLYLYAFGYVCIPPTCAVWAGTFLGKECVLPASMLR